MTLVRYRVILTHVFQGESYEYEKFQWAENLAHAEEVLADEYGKESIISIELMQPTFV
jgi:hypothetical protein